MDCCVSIQSVACRKGGSFDGGSCRTVRWRGHPTVPTEGKTVNDRINELLK
jgi:hypothetical protein